MDRLRHRQARPPLGFAIVRHDCHWLPVQHVATFDSADKATAEAVCRDLNRSVAHG